MRSATPVSAAVVQGHDRSEGIAERSDTARTDGGALRHAAVEVADGGRPHRATDARALRARWLLVVPRHRREKAPALVLAECLRRGIHAVRLRAAVVPKDRLPKVDASVRVRLLEVPVSDRDDVLRISNHVQY